MNISNIQNLLTLVCAAGGLACVAAIVLYSARHVLRELLDQLYAASRLTKLVVLLAFAGATLFGGAKHGSTNEPPVGGDVLGAPQSTNNANSLCGDCGVPGGHALPTMALSLSQTGNEPPLFDFDSQLRLITNWTARGAYCDWKRIDFPDTFAFPSGTNLLTGVTLMSYGELRESLHSLTTNHLLLATLHQPVSLEPDMSSVSYGLTPSNSFVFVWENACVDRDPTNRINAAIELFEDGSIETRFGNLVGRAVPSAPDGFIGEGQNLDWVTNAFPEAASNILERGYSTWLLQDWTGINEQNGHVMTTVTIPSLPSSGPCYLVCGPYKVNVTHPGSYSFPLEVLEEYMIRTYPIAVPISISTDDGYRGIEPSMMMAPPRTMAASDGGNNVHYLVPDARIVLDPISVAYENAVGTIINVWKNAGPMVQFHISSFWGMSMAVMRGDSIAEITQAEINDGIMFNLAKNGYSCWAAVTITPPPPEEYHEHACCADCCGDYCECDGSCCRCTCNCWGYADEDSGGTNSNTNVTQP